MLSDKIFKLKNFINRTKYGYQYVYSDHYLVALDYGTRTEEKLFIKDLHKHFSKNISDAILIVSNNPYKFELYLYIEFVGDIGNFESWLESSYTLKKWSKISCKDSLMSQIKNGGYVGLILKDILLFNYVLTSGLNEILTFPDMVSMNETWPPGEISKQFTIFLCYSGKDKDLIEKIYNEFQKSQIRCWYADYEIKLGESIVRKINEGLNNSSIGIICLSKNFLNATTHWPEAEKNFFIHNKRIKGEKEIIVLNLDLPRDSIPAEFCDNSELLFSLEEDMDSLSEILREKMEKSL